MNKNFDDVLKKFADSSVFTRHESFSDESSTLSNGKIVNNTSGVIAIRTLNGFKEKVMVLGCSGSIEEGIQLMKDVSVSRNCQFSLIDFKDFCCIAEDKLGDMALKSAFLVKHEPDNRYVHISNTEDNKWVLGAITSNGDQVDIILFFKLKV